MPQLRSSSLVAYGANARSLESPKRPVSKDPRLQCPPPFSVIAFSTCWNSGRHTDGDEMLREIKTQLGFDLIELGHGIRLSLMPGIQEMFDAGEVRFSSLHNFCPLPVEVMMASPDCYKFSAVTSEERERAVKQTFQTIDFAERLGAPFVVLHLGEVKMQPITDRLIMMTKVGKHLSRGYVRAKLKAVET